ncbi:hypothetical protein B0H14DRAFT_2568688 [Mycena olivaceomarginata]|nr:hypothetical protein B0H14DRAFT_2568688 [Mycena olivaceomarginata]
MLAADVVRVALFLVLLPEVIAQTTHMVNVGVEGSFYSPPTVSAGLNDTVMFVFGGDVHTVTQSSFDSPCIRLDGGFDSGFNGRGADFSRPAPVWTLRITNVSEPIWFFCQASIPTSHCESGMVGAINPPSIPTYNQFVAAAKLVTSTPKPSPSFIASGQGAFATNSPMPSSISGSSFSLPPTSFSSTPTTSSLSATSTAPVASGGGGGNHIAVIAGCATAGGAIVLIVIALTIFHCRRWRAYRRSVTPLPLPPANGIYDRRVEDKSRDHTSADSSTAATHTFPAMATPNGLPYHRDGTDAEKSTTDVLPNSPGRGVRPLPRTPSHNQLRDADASIIDGGPQPDSPPPQHVDINTLAMEVANVLLQTPPRPGARQHPDSSPNNSASARSPKRGDGSGRGDSGSAWYESGGSEEANQPAPPHYRAT